MVDSIIFGRRVGYSVARVLLVAALLELSVSALIVGRCWWPWSFWVAGGVFLYQKLHRRRPLWSHGTARWANEEELRRAGMIGGTKGLAIGRLGHPGELPLVSRLFSVLDWRISPKTACERFLSRLIPIAYPARGEIVRLANAVHVAIFGPTGAGKGASFIIPWLREKDESAIVTDTKGENALITSEYRRKRFGHRIVFLDPYHVVTNNSDALCPISLISANSPTMVDDCRDLSENLVVKTGQEKEPHFNEAAELWITAANIAVVMYAAPENRSLQTVRDILSNPQKIPELIQLLCSSDGVVARIGSQLAHFKDRELASTLTTANRHLRFLDTPAVAAITGNSTFDPKDLRNGKMTVYCILPPEHARAQAGLIRMWIGTMTRAVIQGGLQNEHR